MNTSGKADPVQSVTESDQADGKGKASSRSSLADLAAVLSVSGGVLYLAGFLTVLTHTSRVGLPIVEAAQLRYVWIGFAPTLLLVIVIAVVMHLWRILPTVARRKLEAASALGRRRPRPPYGSAAGIIGTLTAVGIVIAVASVLSYLAYLGTQQVWLTRFISWPVACVTWFVAVVVVVAAISTTLNAPDLVRHPTVHASVFALPVLLLGVLGIYVYAVRIYPLLPVQYGGGMPVPVRLILDGSSFDPWVLAAAGLITAPPDVARETWVRPSCVTLEHVDLLYTSSDLYLIAVHANQSKYHRRTDCNPQVIAIRKEHVLATCAVRN